MSNKTYRKHLFNRVRDADILAWLDAQENQSEAVRNAIREQMKREGVISQTASNEDILAEIKAIQDQIRNIKVISGDVSNQGETEPEDIVNKLKGFGL